MPAARTPLAEIRRFRAADEQTWQALWLAYYADARTPPPALRVRRRLWRDMQDRSHPFIAWGVWYRGRPAGFLTAITQYSPHAAKPLLYISDLYILPEFRRKRLASKLLKTVFEKYDGTTSRIEWKTRVNNIAAQRLYKKYAKKADWIIFERKS